MVKLHLIEIKNSFYEVDEIFISSHSTYKLVETLKKKKNLNTSNISELLFFLSHEIAICCKTYSSITSLWFYVVISSFHTINYFFSKLSSGTQ